ncbi:MAG: hypothetical protein ACPGQL_10020 [Thermoplasmatota archaeon]
MHPVAAALAVLLLIPVATPELDPAHLPLEQGLAQQLEGLQADGLDGAVAAARLASGWQAERLGHSLAAARVPHVESEGPTAALLALAASTGHPFDAQDPAAARLDDAPESLHVTLTAFIDAFHALWLAADAFYGPLAADDGALLTEGDEALIQRLAAGDLPAALDPSQILAARLAFLDATMEVRSVLLEDQEVLSWRTAQPGIVQPPLVALDLQGGDHTYRKESKVVLLLDAGGDDVYNNNAGGNIIHPLPSSWNCLPHQVVGYWSMGRAAAAVDIGGGNDLYNPIAQDGGGGGCGITGAGYFGVGFLFDDLGNDRYNGERRGMNGGAYRGGIGFLLDGFGNDRYYGGDVGANGGAGGVLFFTTEYVRAGGIGTLIDGQGTDRYHAWAQGVNGGAHMAGLGFLADLRGNDQYRIVAGPADGIRPMAFIENALTLAGMAPAADATFGANGGGDIGGAGFLFDRRGDDLYVAGSNGANGGGSRGGSGFLYDVEGNDGYAAGGHGANGGGHAGTGLLWDAGGRDHYVDDLTSCTDCTVPAKGSAGFQIDVPGKLIRSPT